MSADFAHLGLPPSLVTTLGKKGISRPFPIQSATIPDALAGRDVLGKAPTGSGKTLAFGLPVLARVGRASSRRPTALVLAPTRELAEQIRRELEPLGRVAQRSIAAVYGGVGYRAQIADLRRGVDVLVATPGRLEDLIAQGAVSLGEIEIVVIDEADRMADMGFLPAVRRLLDLIPSRRQTLLFSATLDGDVAVLTRDYQSDPVRHHVEPVTDAISDVRHHFWNVAHADRLGHTADVIRAVNPAIVFTRTRHGADRLARQLDRLGVGAVALHGGRSQNQRDRAMKAFSSGRVEALVATDVAARGIHVDDVAAVIHFDVPADHKDYLHRSGRTARAGAGGTVVTLVPADKRREMGRIRRELGLDGDLGHPRLEDLGALRPERASRSGHHGDRPGPGSRSLYVANLPWRATPEEVSSLFAAHGEVHDVTLIMDRRTRRPKGFGFVDMTQDAGERAIAALHGSRFDGRELTVRFAKPRQAAV